MLISGKQFKSFAYDQQTLNNGMQLFIHFSDVLR